MAVEQGKAATPATKKQDAVAQVKDGVVDVVMRSINQFIANGEMVLPRSYSVENAMKSAWLVLQNVEDMNHNKALEVCTKQSVANALLDMCVQGLSPQKNQIYFIVYGKQLTAQRSYFGSMAVAMMVNPQITEFSYALVYEGDSFKYGIKNGKKTVVEHAQDIDDVKKDKIKAAYCIALDKDGNPLRTDIMTFDEIKQSWRQSKVKPVDANGNISEASTHGKFTGEMSLRTVINRCCKAIINASSDNALLLERINRAEEQADRMAVGIEIEEKANQGGVIDITSKPEKAAPQREDSGPVEQETEGEKKEAAGTGPGF